MGKQRGLLYIIHLQPECKTTGPLLTASLFTGAVGLGNATSHSCSSHAIWNSIPNYCLWSSEWRKSRYGINYVLDFINLYTLMKTRNKILSAVKRQREILINVYVAIFHAITVYSEQCLWCSIKRNEYRLFDSCIIFQSKMYSYSCIILLRFSGGEDFFSQWQECRWKIF